MQEFTIDAGGQPPREVNRTLKEKASKYKKIVIENPNAAHYLVAGLTEPIDVEIAGSAGYFAATMIHGARVHIQDRKSVV